MRRRFLLFVSSFLFFMVSHTQTEKCWVYFTDKDGVEFDPYQYFDEKAIERREKLGLSLNDFTDLPVNESYLEAVEEVVTEISHHTRWFNAVAVKATPEQQIELLKLPFVSHLGAFPEASYELTSVPDYLGIEDLRSENLVTNQTLRMGRRDFAHANIDGAGVRVAVFDAGFTAADKNECFNHLRANNRIIATYDFIKKKENVYLGSSHGTSVLSCIAGIFPHTEDGIPDTLGLATGAEFLLARTEKLLFEVFSEEENWLAAVEWADKNGADIINSSLGYTGDRYTYADMTGNGTLVSRAGNLAAKKGILVVNSAGNDGSNEWNFIGAPADADSVLAIGGLNPWTGIQTGFSSVGPTSDYRLKPNVTAYGHVMGAQSNWISETQGTSFSSPLIAGFAACAWQANPGWSNMELFRELEKRGDLYPYFDYAHGYGVPIAVNFLDVPKEKSLETFETTIKGNTVKVSLLIKINELNDSDKPSLERTFNDYLNKDTDCKLDYGNHLFYHFENEKGHLTSYYVIQMEEASEWTIRAPFETKKIRIHYQGFTKEIKL